jgi:hypothetical protein
MRFTDWKAARTYAVALSQKHHMDVAIRAVKEFGKLGYNVGFADRNGSDYASAEIVPADSQL